MTWPLGDFRGFLVILFGICVASWNNVDTDADMSFMERICNGGKFKAFDLITPVAAATILETVIEETPKAELLDYYADNTAAGLYAHGLCTRSVSSDDCAYCMKSALHQLLENCSHQHIGGKIQLRDCRLRYETYRFRND